MWELPLLDGINFQNAQWIREGITLVKAGKRGKASAAKYFRK
jgi:hypothetical protein